MSSTSYHLIVFSFCSELHWYQYKC